MLAYFLSNICAKNYQNRFMYVRVIVKQISDIFLEGGTVYMQGWTTVAKTLQG